MIPCHHGVCRLMHEREQVPRAHGQFVCLRLHAYVRMCGFARAHTHARTNLGTCMRACERVCVRACACLRACLLACRIEARRALCFSSDICDMGSFSSCRRATNAVGCLAPTHGRMHAYMHARTHVRMHGTHGTQACTHARTHACTHTHLALAALLER